MDSHKITLQKAGEPPIHAFIGTGGEGKPSDSGALDTDAGGKEPDLERDEEALPFAGYKKYE